MQKSRLRVRISALPLLVLSCCLDLTADGLQNPTAVELIGPRSTEAPRGTGGEIVFAGKGLDQVARDQVAKFMFAAEQNGTPDQAIEFSAPELKKQVEDGKKTKKLVVRYEIAKEANLGPHPLRAADKDNNVIVVDSVLTVLPGAPGISPRYVPCPTDGRPMDGSLGVVCSQSLLAWKEASDIFGRRIANFYLVVQLTVRNLRDDFEYLVHDVRLVYDNEHVASRERELVRGVAEKGQGYDRRNLILRAMQAGGSVLAATGPVDNILLKDAANLFQGPFTNGYELLFPDFTVRQANRVSDKVFATNATVVPKGRAVTTVALMPKDIFLSPEDREKHKNGNEKLLNFQRDLRVEIAGAHILEIRSDEPAANTLFPNTGVQREKLQTQLTGQNLDRVEKLRILKTGGGSVDGTVELIQHDSTRAMATFAQLSLEPGEYNVNLVTRDGREHAAPKLLFRVTKAPPKLTGPTNTDVSRNSNGQNEFTGPASDLAEIAKIQAFQNDKLDEAVNLTPGEIKGDKLVASYEIGKDAKLGAHILELTTKGGQTSPTELILTVTEAAPQPRPDGPEETKVKAESGEFTVGFTGANLDQVQKIEAVQNGVVDEAVKFISAEPSEGKLVAKFQAGKADPGKHLWKVIPKKGERILTKLLLIITE